MAKKASYRGRAGIGGPLDASGTHLFVKPLSNRSRSIKGGGLTRFGARGLKARHRSQLRAGFSHRG